MTKSLRIQVRADKATQHYNEPAVGSNADEALMTHDIRLQTSYCEGIKISKSKYDGIAF